MPHLHDDALTLLALGEAPTDEESTHLELCPRCRADLGSFRRVVTAARQAGAEEPVTAAAADADHSGLQPPGLKCGRVSTAN